MSRTHASEISHNRAFHELSRMQALVFSAIGCVLVLSACAKRPEVAGIAPVTQAPPALEAGAPRPGEPVGGPSMGGPGAESGGPSLGGPGAGAAGGPEGDLASRGMKEEGVQGGAGAGGPSRPLPPGSEAVVPPPTPPREKPSAQVAEVAPRESPLKDIFFDFDKADIRPDGKAALAEDIVWLKAHPKAAVTIEGHCDERGTSEYNLGLGERRSRATRDYLVASGIDGKRLHIVSYGKERPFVLGHDESAWRWNRRAHFVIPKE